MCRGRFVLLLTVAVLLLACSTGARPGGDTATPSDTQDPARPSAGEQDQPPEAEPDPPPVEEPGEAADQPTDEDRDTARPDPDRHPAAGLERAVWVHLFDPSLKTRGGLELLVEELAHADATAVIAQAARRHDAYYRSRVLPPTADPDLEAGLDVLAELTGLAHEAGIEVHAWLSIAPTWHAAYEELPAPAGWVPAEHGRTAPEADRWVSRDVDGTWSEYLDPALPEVRAHLHAVVEELATNTEVDGVHLDYPRYASHREGYHPAAVERYRAETGAAGTPSPVDPAWSAWRRDQTRELVATARAAVDAAGRPVTLSAAVIAWGPGPGELGGFEPTRTWREALQDWPDWAQEGLVDAVLPMVYFRDHVPEQAAWFADWITFQQELTQVSDSLVIPGIAGWLNTPEAVLEQLSTAAAAADGVALYSYQQPTDHLDAGGTDGVRPFWGELARTRWAAHG